MRFCNALPLCGAPCLSLFIISCGGGGSDPTPIDLTQNSSTKVSRQIYARGSWQCLGFAVKGGEKLKISSTGQWSGGQRIPNPQENGKLTATLMVDAYGGNGKVYNSNGTIVDQTSLNINLGITGTLVGSVRKFCDQTLTNLYPPGTNQTGCNAGGTFDPATVRPQLLVTVPNNNSGPACSDAERIISYLYGKPNQIVEPHSCLPLDRMRLIGKILPSGATHRGVAPFDVAKNYESTPYEVPANTPANSDICFKPNEADHGIADNDGFLTVTVEKTN